MIKAKFEDVISRAKKFKSTFIVSLDTLKQMVSKINPIEEAKLNEKFKISNQNFKSYNDYKAEEKIVDSIASQIVKTFENYQQVFGYIEVKGSASHVPTTAFGGNNEQLAQARACSFASKLEAKLPEKFKNKIVVDYLVDGPQYENDSKNMTKYEPYQFCGVNIHLNAVKSLPVVNTPEKVVVQIKVLTSTLGVENKVVQTVLKVAKPTGKGGVQSACPLNFDKK